MPDIMKDAPHIELLVACYMLVGIVAYWCVYPPRRLWRVLRAVLVGCIWCVAIPVLFALWIVAVCLALLVPVKPEERK